MKHEHHTCDFCDCMTPKDELSILKMAACCGLRRAELELCLACAADLFLELLEKAGIEPGIPLTAASQQRLLDINWAVNVRIMEQLGEMFDSDWELS